ncbi:hypothetical protein ACFX1Z_024527 [Malus domestica]
MHFVDFCSCWNDFRSQMSTNLFILCDKPQDANLISISFRGREPFYANIWSTEFDYSWYEIPILGGALAILFMSVLVLHEEMKVMQRLLGVYTFGQPRVRDRKLARYMDDRSQSTQGCLLQ